MALHLAGQDPLLTLVTMLKELLDDIVAKHVRHQLDSVGLNFLEDTLLLVTVGSLELLLNETRAVLIAAEFADVLVDILLELDMKGNEVGMAFTLSS